MFHHFYHVLGIWKPTVAKQWCTQTNAYGACISIAICSCIISIPLWFSHYISETGSLHVEYTDWGTSHGAAVYLWFHLVVVDLIPLTTIVMLIFLMIGSLISAHMHHLKTVHPTSMGNQGRQIQVYALGVCYYRNAS